jgi:glutathione S-transferase
MNPTGLVPTIEDEGFTLWESHSIVRYLSARHGAGTLCPTDVKGRADVERWMDWAFTFHIAMLDVFWGLIRTPPEKRDPKAIEEGRRKSIALLPILESVLRARRYVGGDSFTMGDIPVGCEVQRYMRVPIERPSFPAVEAWFERLRERPAFRKNVDIPLS